MNRRGRVIAGMVALVLGIVTVGSVAARWPILGQEWAEWTRYDAAGNAIGGGRIECDGTVQTWGDAGRAQGFTIYPCQ
ncbi:DUF6289 family protein [Luteimonas sp. FCS-9]|uniref:DUF6289 family protein n=1 Tax=Luteimonas sp. FCS-9 TaxID=1547516 RepID=UPI000B1C22AA|nr:DUF6289 family protein [Luteimonas sp. FCS-9]